MNNVALALLWHFHQPIYAKPDDPVLPLPWVRLHCLKDYLDMLRHVQKFPQLQVTFNFSPALLLQIEGYASGRLTDRQFVLFKKRAEDLAPEERVEILRDFFLANWQKMVEPSPRYFSLLLKRGKNIVETELMAIAQSFTVDELRDLQVWANLVWIDPMFRNEIGDLYAKDKNFSEADKTRIIALENTIIGAIFDEYRKAWQSGQIELTTSPLYHPILPLLINSNLAKISRPNLSLPFEFTHPEDARQQIIEGISVFERIFGQKPEGFWPSEGAVCEELMPMAASCGFSWLATDEEILARSLNTSFHRDENSVPNQASLLYKPWKFEKMKIIFRDHVLSDLVGFEYENWDQKNAALDLIQKIKHVTNGLPPSEKFIIPIILDGENAWEHYQHDGTEFLETLYDNLIKENIQTTTISKFLKGYDVSNNLSSVFPGSWIGANFNIWIGQAEDHAAWQMVKKVRDKLIDKKIKDKAIWDEFYRLEGSDWFWWFGNEQYMKVEEIFDELFRSHALWIYRKINEEPPLEFFLPIKKIAEAFSHQPIDRVRPVIDGKVTFFYEWYNAGYADVKRMGGTMHRFAGLFSIVYCGFDDRNLYIRFDVENHDIKQYTYAVRIFEPKELSIVVGESKDIQFKIDEVGEVAIPLSMFDTKDQEAVKFTISALQQGIEVDRTPLLKFPIRLSDVRLHNWTV